MLRGTSSAAVDPIVEYIPGTEEQTISYDEERLAKLHWIVPLRLVAKLGEFFVSIVYVFLVDLDAVVYAVRSNQNAGHC